MQCSCWARARRSMPASTRLHRRHRAEGDLRLRRSRGGLRQGRRCRQRERAMTQTDAHHSLLLLRGKLDLRAIGHEHRTRDEVELRVNILLDQAVADAEAREAFPGNMT